MAATAAAWATGSRGTAVQRAIVPCARGLAQWMQRWELDSVTYEQGPSNVATESAYQCWSDRRGQPLRKECIDGLRQPERRAWLFRPLGSVSGPNQ